MKTLIFGAGVRGKRLFKELSKDDEHEIIGFVDNNPALAGTTLYGLTIYTPDQIMSGEVFFDIIYIAVKDKEAENNINSRLTDLGILESKIVKAVFNLPQVSGTTDEYYNSERKLLLEYYKEWLSEVAGNTAECGVFGGNFAKEINRLFPKKKLYLFDTFEGFDPRDLIKERSLGNKSFDEGIFNAENLFDETSESFVMSQMMYPENVIIKKGYVPDTFTGVDDSFCFVNLDMDLYQPMLAALKFFWERMSPDGIILCHDYMRPDLPGVKQAVADFEDYLGRRVIKDLTYDRCSIAIFKTF